MSLKETYVQGGAKWRSAKKTKTALKEAIKSNPANVYLYGTSEMGPQFRGPVTSLPEGVKFNVVGPDPYRDRSWYATVYRNVKGGITVK